MWFTLPGLRRPTAAAALAALAITLLASPETASSGNAVQDPDRNSKALTGWGWHTSVAPSVISAYVAQGNRIVDLELTSSAPKFSATYVVNSGTYARAWWWYYGKTATAVKNLLQDNNARLTDIEPYSTPNGTRYAVVMVKNTGIAKKAWGWHYNVPLSTITTYAKNHDMRVVDVDRQPSGNRFSAIYIKHAGVDAKGWWHYYNVTANQIKDYLKQKKARIIQLERVSSTRYDVVLQRRSGEYWWWYVNMSQTALSRKADQLGARIFQVKSRMVNGKRRYDALLLNNVNAETTRIRQLVADQMTDSWGFFLKRVGGAESVALGASNTFEPASMMKIVHAVTAMRQMQFDPLVDQNTAVTWYAHPDFDARYPGDVGYRTPNISGDTEHADVCAYDPDNGTLLTGSTYSDALGPVIVAQTLQQSDNRTTDALTRRFGFDGLNATKTLAGMTKSKINHRIGCPGKASPQPLTHNLLTLRDAGKIYEGVQNLTLLNFDHRELLHSYLSGGPIGMGDLRTMVYQEAAAAGLSIADRNLFVAHVETRSKGGSYGYCPNFDGTGTCSPPSVQSRTVGGVIWLPFKVGGRIADTPYVYGRYFDSKFSCSFDAVSNKNCSAYNKTAAGNKTISVEMFRAEVKKALATW